VNKLAYLILIAIAMLATKAVAEDVIEFKATEVASGIYMIEGVGGFAGGNMALSVGDDGIVLIDDSMPPLLEKLKATIKGINNRSVDFLINTHLHSDHTGNNGAFSEGVTHIIGHENMRERLKKSEIDGPEGKMPLPSSALPVITFSQEMSFHLNDQVAQVIHMPVAHTDGDAIIYFRDSNVIHVGDILFNGLYPYIDLGNGGSVAGYIAAQQAIYALINDDTIIIPGHGPVAKKADLKASYQMLSQASQRVTELKKKGKSEDEVVAENPLKDFHEQWSWGFISTEKMTRTLYQDL